MTGCYILLGKLGDILNFLPALHLESLNGVKPHLMVSKDFASVLDGVSYVEPVMFDGTHRDLDKAVEFSKSKDFEPVVVQVIGHREHIEKFSYAANAILPNNIEPSFDKEPWRMAGKKNEWYSAPPLVFDKRDAEREEALVLKHMATKRPVLLLALESKTSPFPHANLLRELVTLKFGKKFKVVELPQAERIYDLVALYESAGLLISIDSAPLHLARACPRLPVFVLAQDTPSYWNGSSWRPNHFWYCRYHDWPSRAVEMLQEIERLPQRISENEIVTVWSEYQQRDPQRDGNVLPIGIGTCGRDSTNTLKDSVRVPYLKDCLQMAFQRAPKDKTWIVLKRPGVVMEWREHTAPPPFYAYRTTRHPQGDEVRSVVDIFCANKSWWVSMMKEIPDLLLGNDYNWSQCLWAVFKQAGAKDVTGICHRVPADKSWSGKESAASKKNRELCQAYISKTTIRSRYPKVSEQVECIPLKRDKLFPFGYNPTVIEDGTVLKMVYRFHKGPVPTSLALAVINEQGEVLDNKELMSVEGRSQDDARFFRRSDGVFISWVDSAWPKVPTTAVVKYARFEKDSLGEPVQPQVPKNDGTTIQKNYVMWGGDTNKGYAQFCLYSCTPRHVVYAMADGKVVDTFDTEPVKWNYGFARGGTPPLEYDGHLLRFFHSRINSEPGLIPWRYFVGAYLMENKPPFKVVHVSQKPIIYGSEVDDLNKDDRKSAKYRKQNVVFPAGVILRNGHWILSLGVNDCQCAVVKIKPEDLNL